MKLTMGPKIKATLAVLAIFGLAGLLLYKPIWVIGGGCVWMTYILWRDLYRFFLNSNK